MRLTLLYSERSSKTGRDLLDKLKPLTTKAFRKRTNKRFKTDVVLRWGSTESFSNLKSKLELNTIDAVENASNKLKMMQNLVGANVPTPKVLFDLSNPEVIDEFKDDAGFFFVRGSNDSVRYDDQLKYGDKYITKPLENKRREYRVHVFNGEVIAIYEKVPNDESVRLFKSHNCSFQLRNPDNCRLSIEDQKVCIDAVNSLGLLFGGVDLLRDKHQKVYVSEVNSAPALNSTNINRYIDKITDYINAMEIK